MISAALRCREPNLIDGGDRGIEVLEPRPGQRALGRRVAEPGPQMRDDGILAGVRAGQCRMAAFSGDECRIAVAEKPRHAETGAGADHRHGLAVHGFAPGEDPDVVRAQIRQGPRDRFEVVDEDHRREAEGAAQLIDGGQPAAVGNKATPTYHRAGHAEHRAVDGTRLFLDERGDGALERGMAGNRSVLDRADAIAIEDRKAHGGAADVCEQCALHVLIPLAARCSRYASVSVAYQWNVARLSVAAADNPCDLEPKAITSGRVWPLNRPRSIVRSFARYCASQSVPLPQRHG